MAKQQKSAEAKPQKEGKGPAPRPRRTESEPRLRKMYHESIRGAMQQKFNYGNPMEIPRLTKIVLNMGVGEGSRDAKLIDVAMDELTQIAGQRPSVRRSRKSIANFKIREQMPVGCAVTLRGARMYEFLDRLINVAIPRVRDFRGLPPKSFDGRGNHGMGIQEHLIFTELDPSSATGNQGLDIITVTTAKTDEEARELLKLFGMPFRER
ncbi:50S ribosomal protein L5 [Candidatus Sumerlaeota bacterium]|nr:50S ribosomal protein L5 [Candidatus Sumerlaeota bacterium]